MLNNMYPGASKAFHRLVPTPTNYITAAAAAAAAGANMLEPYSLATMPMSYYNPMCSLVGASPLGSGTAGTPGLTGLATPNPCSFNAPFPILAPYLPFNHFLGDLPTDGQIGSLSSGGLDPNSLANAFVAAAAAGAGTPAPWLGSVSLGGFYPAPGATAAAVQDYSLGGSLGDGNPSIGGGSAGLPPYNAYPLMPVQFAPKASKPADYEQMEQKRREREVRSQHYVSCLVGYLESRLDKKCTLDEFVTAYADLPQVVNMPNDGSSIPALTKKNRGDLVRLIKRHKIFRLTSITQSGENGCTKGCTIEFEAGYASSSNSGVQKLASNPTSVSTPVSTPSGAVVGNVNPGSNTNAAAAVTASAIATGTTNSYVTTNATTLMNSNNSMIFTGNSFGLELGAALRATLAELPADSGYASVCKTLSDNSESSVSSLGCMSSDSFSVEQETKEWKDQQLTELIIQHMQSAALNPHRGSVSVEKIQNIALSKHDSLYSEVVGRKHNSWKEYIERHSNIFDLINAPDGKLRMRLLEHTDWEDGDLREQHDRETKEQHYVDCLTAYLQSRTSKQCTVDEFLDEYPTLPQNQIIQAIQCLGMPPSDTPLFPQLSKKNRGDLVRLIQRHREFRYSRNNPNNTISLVEDPDLTSEQLQELNLESYLSDSEAAMQTTSPRGLFELLA